MSPERASWYPGTSYDGSSRRTGAEARRPPSDKASSRCAEPTGTPRPCPSPGSCSGRAARWRLPPAAQLRPWQAPPPPRATSSAPALHGARRSWDLLSFRPLDLRKGHLGPFVRQRGLRCQADRQRRTAGLPVAQWTGAGCDALEEVLHLQTCCSPDAPVDHRPVAGLREAPAVSIDARDVHRPQVEAEQVAGADQVHPAVAERSPRRPVGPPSPTFGQSPTTLDDAKSAVGKTHPQPDEIRRAVRFGYPAV